VTAAELIDPGLAQYYMQRALDSARANRRNAAIAAFRRAKALTPGMPISPEREADAAISAHQRIVLEAALRAARDYAANDRMDSAMVAYQSLRSREARPGAATAGYWASLGALRAQAGEVDSALALLTRADSLDRFEVQADHLNYLCWFGSLYDRARDVTDACERAVSLKPSPYIVDSRGLARALVGNLAGAIEDFAAYSAAFADTSTAQDVRQRRDWLARLQAGEAPTTIFTPEILAALRN
jgi:tetratricopeptide (TPR) repeat protein